MFGLLPPKRKRLTKPTASARFNRAWPLFRGLQAFYAFLESKGTTFYELTGQQQPASAVLGSSPDIGNFWGNPGKFGAAVTLDGGTGYINCGNICDNMASFTVSCWFKTSLGSGNTTLIGKMASGGISTGQGWGIIAINGEVGSITQLASGVVFHQLTSSVAYNDNKWHHLVCTVSNYIPQNVYIDGAAVSTTSSGSGSVTTTTTSNNLEMGADSGANDSWNGKLDLVGIWNRVLSLYEIQSLYSDPLAMITAQRLPLVSLKVLTPVTSSGNLVEASDVIGTNVLSTATAFGNLVELSDTIGSNVFQGSGVSASANLSEQIDAIGSNISLPQNASGNLIEKSDTIGSKVTLPVPNSLIILKRRTIRNKPPIGVQIDRQSGIAQGLVFAAPFNEAGGASIHDLISGEAGSFTNQAWQTTDVGEAVYFGATGGPAKFTSLPAFTDLPLTGNGSMSVSFRILLNSTIAGASETTIMGKSDSTDGTVGGTNTAGWNINSDKDHTATAGLDYSYITSPINYSPNSHAGANVVKLEFECNQWNKMGGVYMPTTADNKMHQITICTAGGMVGAAQEIDDYTVYYDGVIVNRLTSIGNSGIVGSKYFYCASGTQLTTSDAAYQLAIGAHPSGSFSAGTIVDNVLIHNRVLTPQEALQLYVDPFCYLKTPAKKIVTPLLPKLISKRFPFPFTRVI